MSIKTKSPPHDTAELRAALKRFFDTDWPYEPSGKKLRSFTWGVYIFYDYDGEPIYVGQTYEKISGRVSRHLTNQRTDAVAMSVLDPFEVAEIEVFPLPHLEGLTSRNPNFAAAKAQLDALEFAVHQQAIAASRFKAILNEKDPEIPAIVPSLPPSFRGSILSDTVKELRSHPDIRIARRAMTIARLTQTIAERQVKAGLRRTLMVQAKRLSDLASMRFEALGGDAIVEKGEADEDGGG